MGIKDQEFRKFVSDRTRLSDLLNGTIFQGKQLIKAEYLREAPRKKSLFLTGKATDTLQKMNSSEGKIQYLERERDVFMLHDAPEGRIYVACEGQTQPDYTMPVREFTYDGVEYSEQTAKGHKGSGGGIKRPLVPVFHQVLYLGEKRWIGKHSLREMMEIPAYVRDYQDFVADYRIYIADIHEQDPELFQTEWKDIFRIMRHSRKREELKKYIDQNREQIRRLSLDTRLFLAVLLDQYKILEDGKVEVKEMCEAWDGAMLLYKEEGIKTGFQTGMQTGIEAMIRENLSEGRSRVVILDKLQKYFSLTREEAEEYYEKYALQRV
ncbi:MAG: Rpn family recombination-promoting nuclease/putative transposase [Eubacteriales bacterium]|nr:Rpn family recombination-promoting nuclease/putative transposase [Eubacteriales bacterium]